MILHTYKKSGSFSWYVDSEKQNIKCLKISIFSWNNTVHNDRRTTQSSKSDSCRQRWIFRSHPSIAGGIAVVNVVQLSEHKEINGHPSRRIRSSNWAAPLNCHSICLIWLMIRSVRWRFMFFRVRVEFEIVENASSISRCWVDVGYFFLIRYET